MNARSPFRKQKIAPELTAREDAVARAEDELRNRSERVDLRHAAVAQHDLENMEREAELRAKADDVERDEEDCVKMMQDYEAVAAEVRYLSKQRQILEKEIEGKEQRHAALAASFAKIRLLVEP